MTLLTEKGTFTKRSGTGSQTVTLTDSSLTPKVLWLWSTGVTSDATYAEHYSVAYGFSDGTNDACIGIDTEDNQGTSDCAHIFRNNAVISILDPSGGTAETIAGTADVTSFNAGNFILNWSASNTSAIIIHYMVAGGSDITNVKVTQHSIASTAGTGTESFTGVGFQGDFINIIAPYARASTGYDGTVNTAGSDMGLLIGAATSSTARWFLGSIADDGSTSGNTFSIYDTAQFLAGYNPLTQARAILANFSAFASDGFDLNLSQEDMTGGTLPFASLVIKGGLWNVGTGTAPASTGLQTINTTAGRYPYGVMFYTWGNTSTSSGTAPSGENRIAIGGTDYNLNEGCISVHDLANQTNYVNSKINLNSKLIRAITTNATASSSTTVAEADISSMSSSGSFAVNWSTTLSGMNYVWFSVGSTTAPAVTTTVSETSIHKYNITGNALQTSIHKYNLAAYIAQNSIQKYNILSYIAQTSIHKYNLLQNILQSNIQKYNIIGNVLRAHIQKYDILNTVTGTNIHKYNILQNILQTSIHKYHLFANILQSSIHKYDMSGVVAALSKHKYDIRAYIAQTNIHKYNILNTILQSSIHKYNLLQNIAQSSIHKYNLLQNILQTNIHKYNLLQNIVQTSIHKYNLLQYIAQTSIHKFDIQVLGAVVNALIAKYDIRAYIAQTSVEKYNILQNILQSSIHKYNLLINVLQGSTQKYHILQNVVQASIQKYNLLQNILQSSIHKYDVLIEAATVLVNSIHKYNILNTVLETSRHKYDLLNTVARTSIHKYNILANVLRSSIHKYNMGGVISSQSRHLYNIIREVLGSTVSGGVAKKPTLKQIRYPVYRIEEVRKLELRRRLKRTQSVIIPAFEQNIHRTVAPFVVTNPITNRVTVRFAIVKREPVLFSPKQAVPLQIAAKTHKNAANRGKAPLIMQQKAIEKYGKRLNKLQKLMKVALLLKIKEDLD